MKQVQGESREILDIGDSDRLKITRFPAGSADGDYCLSVFGLSGDPDEGVASDAPEVWAHALLTRDDVRLLLEVLQRDLEGS